MKPERDGATESGQSLLRVRLVPGIAVLFLLVSVPPAAAELVVFEDGRVVKAASFRVVEDELEISLPGGGNYRVDLARVERIVDDEVAAPESVSPPAEGPPVAYDLSYRPDRKPLFGTPYDRLIETEARRYNVDAQLVSALIRAESNYEPRAVSRKGARGLMQLMPATARRLTVRYPFDPVANVGGGVRYLRELADRFGQKPELVLAAYNAGESVVDSYGGVPPFRETADYIRRILSWWTPMAAQPGAASKASGALP
ncbi:MAG TPA: lytic transglycosylase domain-containing protein [Thermoanaerobaculia bacterium]|nr:lytic transglycosylase domain-containing protein [Thermoanaerobaculia bacterium]